MEEQHYSHYDPTRPQGLLEDEGAPDILVRRTARLCSVIRDANRESWFSPLVRAQIESLKDDLERHLDEGPYRMEVEPNCVRVGRTRMDDPPKAVRQLIHMFRRKGYTGVEFRKGLDALELVVFCQILQSKSARVDSRDLQQLKNVVLLEEIEPERIQVPEIVQPSRLGKMMPEHDGADNKVREMVADITFAIDALSHNGSGTPTERAKRAGNSASGLLELVDELGSNAEIALILSSLRRHDEYTYDHSINVGLLSICLARYLGWKGRDLHEFGVAALIHDVGKLYTPLEVLNKPGRFTPQEWVTMKKHPRDGYDILKEGGVGSDMAPSIAIEHHINEDGEGYPPLPYPKSRIHPGSMIVKIADVYDAFTTIRPYRSQARPREVLKMFRKQAGTMFNREMVEAFCEMMGDYPIGSTVKLKSGLIGLVVDVHPEVKDRPVVRIIQDETGMKPKQLKLIDLCQRDPESGAYRDGVVEVIDPVIRNIPVGRYI